MQSYGGHEILNHEGRRIRVTRPTIKALDMRNYLRRDRGTGLLQIKPTIFPLIGEIECSGNWAFFRELGPDGSGPNQVVCRCSDCRRLESELDKTLTPDEERSHRSDGVDEIIRDIRRKRSLRQ